MGSPLLCRSYPLLYVRGGDTMTQMMEMHRANFTGQWVAECPACHMVCPYWDEEDLNDDGQLECGNCHN